MTCRNARRRLFLLPSFPLILIVYTRLVFRASRPSTSARCSYREEDDAVRVFTMESITDRGGGGFARIGGTARTVKQYIRFQVGVTVSRR